MKFAIDIDSEDGLIQLGPARIHWYNKGEEEDDYPFCIFGWNDYNIEFGQCDQDAPGIYLTRYTYLYDVEHLFTFVRFS